MAIWLEVRCEGRSDGRSEFGKFRCWSDDNNGPGVMSDETQRGVISAVTELSNDCISAGWKKIRGEGWVCPACQAYEANQGEDHA